MKVALVSSGVQPSNAEGDLEVYVVNADGSKRKNLSNNVAASDLEPNWGR